MYLFIGINIAFDDNFFIFIIVNEFESVSFADMEMYIHSFIHSSIMATSASAIY